MPDVSSQVSALVTGEVDYVERLPADVLPVLERNRNVRVQVVSSYGYQGILRFITCSRLSMMRGCGAR